HRGRAICVKRQIKIRSRKSVLRGLSGFGLGLEAFGEFLDCFRLLDEVDGKYVGRRGLLKFVTQGGSKLVKALDTFAEFFFVLEQAGAHSSGFGGAGASLGSVRNLGRSGRWGRRGRILRCGDCSRESQRARQQSEVCEKVATGFTHGGLLKEVPGS